MSVRWSQDNKLWGSSISCCQWVSWSV